jgi:hypothetical protein
VSYLRVLIPGDTNTEGMCARAFSSITAPELTAPELTAPELITTHKTAPKTPEALFPTT